MQPRVAVNRLFYRAFKGWLFADLSDLVERWWQQIPLQKRWIGQSIDALERHKKAGHPVILLSGSADFILKPIARHLKVDITLAITLGIAGKAVCDGEIIGIQTIGDGKREALAQCLYLLESDARLVGYGDHESDLPFLSFCDEAYVVFDNDKEVPLWAEGLSLLLPRRGQVR